MIQFIKKTYSFFILSKRKFFFTFRKFINKKDIWNVYNFKNYNEYLELQKTKTLNLNKRSLWLKEEWTSKLEYFENKFSNIIDTYSIKTKSKSICLGARTGQEVKAFQNLNIDSIGIDIVPNEPLVIFGDIHEIPFNNNMFDIVFTNIVDHSLYPEKLVEESERVCKSGGIIIFHITVGKATDKYGVTEILKSKSVENLFKNSKILKSHNMEPWHGLNWEIILKKNSN